ncbi:MAG: hypothetical protein B7Y42_00340 [Polaromonas sp. 28-63-22]|jgi:hypothetical protein|nr:MAG: hypothetical protein B7Y42_00340 [Polaromonas sp. 28-63-22]
MTKEEWAAVEAGLRYPYDSVKLLVDGHNLTLQVQPDKPMKMVIAWYVDGAFKGAWLKADSDIGKRFACPHAVHLYTPTQKARIRKDYGKRGTAKYFPELDRKATYLGWTWASFRSLKKHLIANNQSINIQPDDTITVLTSERAS